MNAHPSTPKEWRYVKILRLATDPETFALASGEHDCYIGCEAIKGAGIERSYGLTLEQAIANGEKLDAFYVSRFGWQKKTTSPF